jgi:hypothetical protein
MKITQSYAEKAQSSTEKRLILVSLKVFDVFTRNILISVDAVSKSRDNVIANPDASG